MIWWNEYMARYQPRALRGPFIKSLGLYTHNLQLSCFVCHESIQPGDEYGFVNDFKTCRACWEKVDEEEEKDD